MSQFILNAVVRGEELQGKGASRRLRKQNLVPSVIYGGNDKPVTVSVKLNELVKSLEDDAFFATIIKIAIEGGEEESVIIKDLQRHPAKGFPMHADFQRIVKGQMLSMSVPVRFEGADTSPAIKAGATLSTTVVELDINCIPSNIPEYLVVDVSEMKVGDSLRLSDIKLPEGVTLADLEAGTDRTVANLNAERAEEEVATDAPEAPVTEVASESEE